MPDQTSGNSNTADALKKGSVAGAGEALGIAIGNYLAVLADRVIGSAADASSEAAREAMERRISLLAHAGELERLAAQDASEFGRRTGQTLADGYRLMSQTVTKDPAIHRTVREAIEKAALFKTVGEHVEARLAVVGGAAFALPGIISDFADGAYREAGNKLAAFGIAEAVGLRIAGFAAVRAGPALARVAVLVAVVGGAWYLTKTALDKVPGLPTAVVDFVLDSFSALVRDTIGLIASAISSDANASELSPIVSQAFNAARNWVPRVDPFALDLDGDGLETFGEAGDGTVLFDHDGNGVRNGTGWLTGDDGWLVLDRDGDGAITSGAELFGVDTALPDGTKASDGFAAIAPLDTNGDRKLDLYDAAFAGWQIARDLDGDGQIGAGETRAAEFGDLRVWRDRNLDGISQVDEIMTLAGLAIASIQLDGRPDGRGLPGGNRVLSTGTYTRTDGSTGQTASLDLSRHTFYRSFVNPPPSDPTTADLPDVRGSGRVRDLREAAALSPELRSAIDQIAAAGTRGAQWALMDALLAAWAATSDMPGAIGQMAGLGDPVIFQYAFPGVPTVDVQTALAEAVQPFIGQNYVDLPDDWFTRKLSPEYLAQAERLSLLERFMGQTYANLAQLSPQIASYTYSIRDGTTGLTRVVWSINVKHTGWWIASEQMSQLTRAYEALKESAYASIAVQTRLKSYLDDITLELRNGAFAGDFTSLEQRLADRKAADPANALTDLIELTRYAGPGLLELGWFNGLDLLREWVVEAEADPTLAPVLAEVRASTYAGGTKFGTQYGDTVVATGAGNSGYRRIYGFESDDVLLGGDGSEEIDGGPGRDVIVGGPGFDYVAGGTGRDVYVFGRDSYYDWLNPSATTYPADRDILLMEPDVAPADVIARRLGAMTTGGSMSAQLLLQIRGTTAEFRDFGYFAGDTTENLSRSIDEIRFADGTVWDASFLRQTAIQGTDGSDGYGNGPGLYDLVGFVDSDDLIDGKGGSDRILGLAGNDTLLGGAGGDALFGDDGDDRLDGGPDGDSISTGRGFDTVVLARGGGVDYVSNSSWVSSAPPASSAELDTIEVAEDIDPSELVLRNGFTFQGGGLTIQVAGDGAAIVDSGFPSPATSSGSGRAIGQIVFLKTGEIWDFDRIRLASIEGTDGDDDLVGFRDYDDVFSGGPGNDRFFAYEGDNVLDGGAGNDFLSAYGGADRLVGGEGNDSLQSGAGEDYLDGGPGNDTMSGSEGRDHYVFRRGDGDDTIQDDWFAAFDDVFELRGFAPGDLIVDGAYTYGQDIHVRFAGSADSLRFEYWWFNGAEANQPGEFRFDDGTVLGHDEIVARMQRITEGDDALRFGDDPVVVYAKGGNDSIASGAGADTLSGEAGDDVILGGGGADKLYGGTGADFLDGGSGDDQFDGGPGDDRYAFGPGTGLDTVNENDATAGNVDTVVLAPGVRPADIALHRTDSTLHVLLAGTADRLVLTNWFLAPQYRVERVEFADGTVWDETVLARAFRVGRPGLNDTLSSFGDGDDYYLFGRGFGQDVIVENQSGSADGGEDLLAFAADVAPADVERRRLNNDLELRIAGTADAVTLRSWFLSPQYRIERVEFADGTVWDEALLARTTWANNPGASDTVYSYNAASDDYYLAGRGLGDDTFYDNASGFAGGGSDTLIYAPGVAPGEVYRRRVGSDLVLGISGTTDRATLKSWFAGPQYRVERVEFADGTVWGEAELLRTPWANNPGASDTVYSYSATSDDYYLAGRGLGDDTFYDNAYGLAGGGSDTLIYEPGVAPAEVYRRRVGNDVVLGITGTADRVALKNWFYAPQYRVERIEFADGASWDEAYLAKAPRYGNAGQNDTIQVTGASGDDYFLFGRGFGKDTIYENLYGYTPGGNDAVVLEPDLGPGDVSLAKTGFDLVLSLDAGPDTLTLKNWFYHPVYRVEQVQFADGRVWDAYYLENLGVVPNRPPELASPIGDQAASEDTAFRFTVPATAFRDPDPWHLLTFAATLAGGGVLPGWLAFDPATRTFSGTPANGDIGSVDIELTATDDAGAQISDTFGITVANTNGAPAVTGTLPRQRADEDAPFAYALPVGFFTDADAGDTLALSARLAGGGPLPAWLAFDPGAGAFSGTPTDADFQNLTVEVTATDAAGAAATATLEIEVASTPDAPVLAQAPAPQTANEDDAWSLVVPGDTFADTDAGDVLTYSAARADGSPLPGWLAFDEVACRFHGTPANGDVGTVELAVTATDTTGLSARANLTLTVVNTPDAPVLAVPISDQSATEDAPFSFTVPATAFTDPDAGDTLVHTAALAGGGALPAWLAFDPATRTFSGTPTNGDVGNLDIEVTAADGSGAEVPDTFRITVANTNDAPTVNGTLPRQRADEDAPFAYTLPGGLFSDEDPGDSLTLAARLASGAALPAWLVFDPATGLFGGTPGDADVQDLTVEVTATDAAGATASATLEIEVANTPDAPVLVQALALQTANEDEAWSLVVPGATFADADAGDVLTNSAARADGSALPAWLTFDSPTRAFGGTPANADVGTVVLAVTATDATGLSAVANVTLTVVNTPDAPTLAAGTPDQTATENEWFTYAGSLDQFADDDLAHGDTLALTATLAGGDPLPGWLAFDPSTFTFSGTPEPGDAGMLAIEVTATDTTLRRVVDTFTLTVAPAEAAPVTPSDDWASIDEDGILELPVADLLSNDGSDPASLQVVAVANAQRGTVSLDGAGLVTFLPEPDYSGAASFEYVVSNGAGSTGTATVWVDVAPENDAPVLVGTLPQVDAAARQAFELALPADLFRDVDEGDALSYGLEGDAPWWLQFDPWTLALSGEPDNVGTFRLTLVAMDGYGETARGEFDLVVAPGGPIVGTESDDSLYGTDAADTLIGLGGADWLDGAAGADEMRGGAGDDSYSVDDPADLVVEAPGQGYDIVYSYVTGYVLPDGAEELQFWVGEPVHGVGNTHANMLAGGEGADLLEGLDGADTLYGYAGDDELRGGGGRDGLDGWDGEDLLVGGDGEDWLSGGEGADLLDGGAGRDWLDGGAGRDTYFLARGGDRDELQEYDTTEINVIRVADDLAPADLIVRNPWGSMLTIGVRDTNDVVAIGLWPFESAAQVPFVVEFADGTAWDAATLAGLAAAGAVEDAAQYGTEAADTFAGTPGTDQFSGAGGDDVVNGAGGDDWLYGDAGDDVIDGGPGDDSMIGGEGSDTYRFGRGSGQDYLSDGGWDEAEIDTLALGAGIAPRDVVLRGDSWNRLLELIGSSDRLTFDVTIERLAFADGTVWGEADIALRLVRDEGAGPLYGTAGADLLVGTFGGDEIHGFEGDDVLDPGDGPWWSDADTLLGGEGDDTYFLRPGIGTDMILDLAGDLDRIEVAADFLPADVRVARRGTEDLELVVDATGDTLILRSFFLAEFARIEEVRFADGTVWHDEEMAGWGNEPTEADDVLVGGPGADLFDGLGGYDQVYGLGGDDALFGGDGVDSLWGGDGADVLDGGADDDTLLAGPGDDLARGGAGADQVLDYDGGVDVLEGGEGDDGLNATAGRALLAGGAGDDQVYLWTGEAGVLAGGTGDDQLIFGADALLLVNRGDGADSAYAYVYAAPRASLSLGGGIAYEDLALEESGGSLVVHLGNGERLVLDDWYNDPAKQVVEQVQFIAEAMAGYDPGGADGLRDQRIERFDFKALVAAFDAVRGEQVAAQWSAMDTLLAAHLGGSDTEALGGDLAYRYGLAGGFGEIGKSAAQSILAEPGLAAAPQALRPMDELGADPVRLG